MIFGFIYFEHRSEGK